MLELTDGRNGAPTTMAPAGNLMRSDDGRFAP
jgi:hypothetical protein